jgi:hypothetical protein
MRIADCGLRIADRGIGGCGFRVVSTPGTSNEKVSPCKGVRSPVVTGRILRAGRKESLDGVNGYRLEAYATLRFGASSDSSEVMR